MSDDNVVSFPGTDAGKEKEKAAAKDAAPDDVLKAAVGRYDDVIIIGLNSAGGQCISSMPLREAVYELSRAIHRIHEYME